MDSITDKAVEEILKEAKRGSERAETMGPSGWLKPKVAPTNKRFLRQTLLNGRSHNLHMDKGRKERALTYSEKLYYQRRSLNAGDQRMRCSEDIKLKNARNNELVKEKKEHVDDRTKEQSRHNLNRCLTKNSTEKPEYDKRYDFIDKSSRLKHRKRTASPLTDMVHVSTPEDNASSLDYHQCDGSNDRSLKAEFQESAHKRCQENIECKEKDRKVSKNCYEDLKERTGESSQSSLSIKNRAVVERSSQKFKVKAKHKRECDDGNLDGGECSKKSKHEKKFHKHKKRKKNYD